MSLARLLLPLWLGAAIAVHAAESSTPITPVPPPTEADRMAARPPAMAHDFHDNALHGFVLADQLEYWNADPGSGTAWSVHGWLGTDLDRLWLRTEGTRAQGHLEDADVQLLFGHAVSRWWDVVAGARRELGRDGHTWEAIGMQGLAPARIEADATAYATAKGRTALRVDAAWSLLLTNRLVLQPRVELWAYGKDDDAQLIASGISSLTAGLRLRHEFTRRFAPYAGVELERALGDTATARRRAGKGAGDTRVVLGLRTWF